MAEKLTAVKGMNDLLPADSHAWEWLEEVVRQLMRRHGYRNVRTPIVEPTALFVRGLGEVTDIVEKEMYTFEDRLNGDSLTLRPEATAGVVRAAVEHNLLYDGGKRLYYMGPMFRHERPQRGRYRQFHQIGAEALGFAGPEVDAELIVLAQSLWKELGLRDVRLELNSLGQPAERLAHRQALIAYLEQHIDVLDEEAKRRLHTNHLRILDTKNPAMQAVAEGVLAVDADLRVTFSNRAFLATVGRTGDCVGLPLLEVTREAGLHQLLKSVMLGGSAGTSRLSMPTSTQRVFEVHATLLDTPNGRGALAIFHDITELERLDQIRKDLVANVSHELRTPLAGIIGSADTLLDGALEDPVAAKRFTEMIRSNAVRLSNIAADLLVLSDLESGSGGGDAEPVLLQSVITMALQPLEHEAHKRDVSLILPENNGITVHANRLRLEQVLINLAANAIKFNRPGGEVRVTLGSDQGMAVISVTDTGIGIPSEDLPRIFERFYRVDKARSRDTGGTGLGLSIVKHAVERMGGTIQAESQLGKGSRFTVRLRL